MGDGCGYSEADRVCIPVPYYHCFGMGMAEITICYGMTETSPVSTQTGADDDLDRRTSTVGRVHPHLEVKIVDPSTA